MMKLIEQLTNVNAAIALVERTPAKTICMDRWASNTGLRNALTGRYYPTVDELARGAWGTRACLGGLLPADPYFASLGVKQSALGAPYMDEKQPHTYLTQRLGTFDVAEHLFGDRHLFRTTNSAAWWLYPPDKGGTHKEIVLNRLIRRRVEIMGELQRQAEADRKVAFTTLSTHQHVAQPREASYVVHAS